MVRAAVVLSAGDETERSLLSGEGEAADFRVRTAEEDGRTHKSLPVAVREQIRVRRSHLA